MHTSRPVLSIEPFQFKLADRYLISKVRLRWLAKRPKKPVRLPRSSSSNFRIQVTGTHGGRSCGPTPRGGHMLGFGGSGCSSISSARRRTSNEGSHSQRTRYRLSRLHLFEEDTKTRHWDFSNNLLLTPSRSWAKGGSTRSIASRGRPRRLSNSFSITVRPSLRTLPALAQPCNRGFPLPAPYEAC
jgi:hypothetical protein